MGIVVRNSWIRAGSYYLHCFPTHASQFVWHTTHNLQPLDRDREPGDALVSSIYAWCSHLYSPYLFPCKIARTLHCDQIDLKSDYWFTAPLSNILSSRESRFGRVMKLWVYDSTHHGSNLNAHIYEHTCASIQLCEVVDLSPVSVLASA